MTALEIRQLASEPAIIERLAEILVETVASGGVITFMHPVSHDVAVGYWSDALADSGRIVLGGFLGGRLVGTVTLWLATPPNQPFRAEIWKLMTDPRARGLGVGRALMLEAERLAVERGRTLLNLDTALQGGAAPLYESLGWIKMGEIPDYSYAPHGGLVSAAFYYKRVEPPPA